MNYSWLKKLVLAVCSIPVPVVSLALILDSTTSLAAAKQSSAITAVYGRGVHAYFAGNRMLAEQNFTQVIQAGSTDPRPYYFRAMVRLQRGSQFEAENDMRLGAAHEARNPGSQHSIGLALQRVQGHGRRTLEKFRRQARLDRLQQRHQQTRQRYEQLDQRGPTVIRRPAVQIPLGQPVRPPLESVVPGPARTFTPAVVVPNLQTPVPALGVPSAAEPDRFPQSAPAGSGSKTDNDDFFDAPAPVTTSDDPFGSADESAAPTPALDEADPFGQLPSPATEAADPFGEGADEEPVSEEPTGEEVESGEPMEEEASDADDPFGDSTPAEEDDPFGDTTPAESEPAEEAPPEEASDSEEDDSFDPFGAASPQTESGFAGESLAEPGIAQRPDATRNPGSMNPGQIFFAVGHWIGSQTGAPAKTINRAATDSQAAFEFGPTEDNRAMTASAEMAIEDNPLGTADTDAIGTDATGTDVTDSGDASDDPFGDF